MPRLAAHVWRWWVSLCETRPANGFGLQPLSRHDLHAWEADEGVALEPWERRAIFAIDAAYRKTMTSTEGET